MDFNFFRQRVNAIIGFVWGESTEIHFFFFFQFFFPSWKQMSSFTIQHFVCIVSAFKFLE